MNTQLKLSELPINLCGISRCFYNNLYSQNDEILSFSQTTHINLASFTESKQNLNSFENHIQNVKNVYDKLGLNYKIIETPSEKLENYAYRKFEIHTQIPSKNRYFQTGQIINYIDYSASRLNILYTAEKNKILPVNMVQSQIFKIEEMILFLLEYKQKRDGTLNFEEITNWLNNLS